MRTCRAHYPGGSERVHVSIASPFHAAFPKTLGGSASALSFSRPAQASLTLRPARSLNRPRRPLSRGFDGTSCPATPPVSYQLNRQLAGCSIGAINKGERKNILNEFSRPDSSHSLGPELPSDEQNSPSGILTWRP